MPRKLGAFKRDILNLLKSVEPGTLFWREIRAKLQPAYGSKYKDEKVFRVALTNNLTWLKSEGLVKQVGDKYGTPKAHFKYEETPIQEEHAFWKKQASEDFIRIRNAINNQSPDQLILVPEATLRCLDTYSSLKEKVTPSAISNLERLIKWACTYPEDFDFWDKQVKKRERLIKIAKGYVPKVLEEVFKLLHES